MAVRTIVIDDDEDTVEVYTAYLRSKGIEVVGVGYNGRDAVELYKELQPDIVLLDVMMPEFDGFYALSEIRKLDPSSKILMTTADKTEETRRILQSSKVNGIVYKPYEINDVLEAVDIIQKGKMVYSIL